VTDTKQHYTWRASLVQSEHPGRFSDSVDFAYPIREREFQLERAAQPGEPYMEVATRVATKEGQRILEEVGPPEGLEVVGSPTSIGRGAEGLGLALQILEVTGIVTGSILGVVETAKLIARFWKRLLRKKGPPMLSMGAIKMLCIADLANRVEDLTGFEILHADDVSGGSETSHTGLDLFLVLFLRREPTFGVAGELWIYLVDAHGKVVHIQSVHEKPLWTIGVLGPPGQRADRDSGEGVPPFLLGAESELQGEEDDAGSSSGPDA
jgi:hypothetical protein